jgi:Mn2+/Fe2+ NRAMP family transporter
MSILVLAAVIMGCAAYQAGNILGAAAGTSLRFPWPPSVFASGIACVAAVLLWTARTDTVARVLGLLVGIMGLAFLVMAVQVGPSPGEIARDLTLPRLPRGSSLVLLGLVGTTVVPYNLFLGSGLARGRSLPETRLGLAIAIGAGGLVSLAIVVAGTAVPETVSFETIGRALEGRFGTAGSWLFAVGLFSAGFTSSMTAPLAAAIAARGVLDDGTRDWSERSARYRCVWLGVLIFGAAFGVAGVRPIPVILLAQALNGVLLPFVAVSLLLLVNDRLLLGSDGLAGPVGNAALALAAGASVLLGAQGLLRAMIAAGLPDPGEGAVYGIGLLATMALGWPVGRAIVRGRRA